MFQHLLESNAVRRPRVGGSLVSTVGHAALVAAAITITTQHVDKPAAIVDRIAPLIEVARPAPQPDAVHGNSSSAVESAPTFRHQRWQSCRPCSTSQWESRVPT